MREEGLRAVKTRDRLWYLCAAEAMIVSLEEEYGEPVRTCFWRRCRASTRLNSRT